jgi:hypothetical protein
VRDGNGRIAMANLARADVSAAVMDRLYPALREAIDRRVASTRRLTDVTLASEVKPFQAPRKNVHEPLQRSVFTRAAMDSGDERRVAILLDRCKDVDGWVYNHAKVGYAIDYEFGGRAARYVPDFVARGRIGGVEHNVIIEVKGRFDDRDKAKARRGREYAELLTVADGRPWHYVFLLESPSNNRRDITWWESLSETRLEDLLRRHENLPLFPEDLTARRPPAVVASVAEAARYREAWPVYDLVAAAGAFGTSQAPEPTGWMHVAPEPGFDRACFVARTKGASMLPHVPDGAWVLFRRWEEAPPLRALDGRRVLVELRADDDPDTGGRYTVKRWRSAAFDDDGNLARVELRPDNPACRTLSLTADDGALRVVAELLRVIG